MDTVVINKDRISLYKVQLINSDMKMYMNEVGSHSMISVVILFSQKKESFLFFFVKSL